MVNLFIASEGYVGSKVFGTFISISKNIYSFYKETDFINV